MLEVMYGTSRIPFKLTFSDRKTLEINVLPDATVHLVAPKGADLDRIKRKVLKRGYWIVEQQQFFRSLLPYEAPKEYVSGETHFYIGRRYRLQVIEQPSPSVKLKGKFIVVETPDKTNTLTIQKQLEDWYRKQATRRFGERLKFNYEKIKSEGISFPTLTIKLLHKRWGSCTKQGITLNLNLIKAPIYCIDYVIMHELCHLQVPNHSPAFYRLKERYMLDWKDRKKMLEGIS